MYNLGWKAYLEQRETDERRRKRERANAEKKAGALMAQADKMRAKATKAIAAQNMARRAEKLLAGLEERAAADKVAKSAFPEPGAVRQDAADRDRPVQVVRLAGDLHRRRPGRSTGAPGWPSSASTAPARRRCCGCSAGVERRTPARSRRARSAAGLLRPGARDARRRRARCWRTCAPPRPSCPTPTCARSSARSCSPATT